MTASSSRQDTKTGERVTKGKILISFRCSCRHSKMPMQTPELIIAAMLPRGKGCLCFYVPSPLVQDHFFFSMRVSRCLSSLASFMTWTPHFCLDCHSHFSSLHFLVSNHSSALYLPRIDAHNGGRTSTAWRGPNPSPSWGTPTRYHPEPRGSTINCLGSQSRCVRDPATDDIVPRPPSLRSDAVPYTWV